MFEWSIISCILHGLGECETRRLSFPRSICEHSFVVYMNTVFSFYEDRMVKIYSTLGPVGQWTKTNRVGHHPQDFCFSVSSFSRTKNYFFIAT